VQHALFRANGNEAEAARLLGVSEPALRDARARLFTPHVAPEPTEPRASNVVRGPWKSRE
jgi:hypothetical protein